MLLPPWLPGLQRSALHSLCSLEMPLHEPEGDCERLLNMIAISRSCMSTSMPSMLQRHTCCSERKDFCMWLASLRMEALSHKLLQQLGSVECSNLCLPHISMDCTQSLSLAHLVPLVDNAANCWIRERMSQASSGQRKGLAHPCPVFS